MLRPFARRLFTVFLLPIIGAVVIGLHVSKPVWAHAELMTTIPEQGAILQQLPTEIVLTFDEPVQPAASIRLIADGFSEIVELPTQSDAEQLIGAVDGLTNGRWTVQWAVISADGDQISGNYQFELQAATPWTLWARWIVYALILGGLIGFMVRYLRLN